MGVFLITVEVAKGASHEKIPVREFSEANFNHEQKCSGLYSFLAPLHVPRYKSSNVFNYTKSPNEIETNELGLTVGFSVNDIVLIKNLKNLKTSVIELKEDNTLNQLLYFKI